MDLAERAYTAFYVLFHQELGGHHLPEGEKQLKPNEIAAAKLVVAACGVMPNRLKFEEISGYFGEDMMSQIQADFEKGLVVKIKGDSSVTFFYGKPIKPTKDGSREGIWIIRNCTHCRAKTIYGGSVKNLLDIQSAPSEGGPWWHEGGCKVVTPSEPCH